MMAIHPDQVPIINAAFTPSEAEIAHARRVVEAFEAIPGAGALSLDGRMIDRPHLVQAQRLLATGPFSSRVSARGDWKMVQTNIGALSDRKSGHHSCGKRAGE